MSLELLEKQQDPDEMIKSIREELTHDYKFEEDSRVEEIKERLRESAQNRRDADFESIQKLRNALIEEEHQRTEDEKKDFKSVPVIDEVTGVLNQRNPNTSNFLSEVLERAKEEDIPVCFIAFDFDGFKPINDTLSEEVGDACIDSFASALKERLRSTDFTMRELRDVFEKDDDDSTQGYAARLGGDDYSVMLPGANPEDIPEIVADISLLWTERLRFMDKVFGDPNFDFDAEGVEEELKDKIGPGWDISKVKGENMRLERKGKDLREGTISDSLMFSAGATLVNPNEDELSDITDRAKGVISRAKGKNLAGFPKILNTFNSLFTGKENYSNRLVVEYTEENPETGEIETKEIVNDIRPGMKAPPRTSLF